MGKLRGAVKRAAAVHLAQIGPVKARFWP